MIKALLIDENGNANTVWMHESYAIGDTGHFELVETGDMVYGEIEEIME